MAGGLIACATRGEPGEVYNLASGVETSIRRARELINELTAIRRRSPAPARDWDHSGQRYGSTAKARDGSASTRPFRCEPVWSERFSGRRSTCTKSRRAWRAMATRLRRMNCPIKTLLLEANGTHWAAVAIDTFGQGLLTKRAHTSPWMNRFPLLRKLFGDRYSGASYMSDWRDAFCSSDALEVECCNITNLLEFRANRPRIRDYDFVVVLHSAAGDRMAILNRAAHWFQGRRGKLAVFIGNEYDLMDEKISFIRTSWRRLCVLSVADRTGRISLRREWGDRPRDASCVE